jgi:hypothetical protein
MVCVGSPMGVSTMIFMVVTVMATVSVTTFMVTVSVANMSERALPNSNETESAGIGEVSLRPIN